MPYIKRTWVNSPSTDTPINADSLNNIENGVKYASDFADTAGNGGKTLLASETIDEARATLKIDRLSQTASTTVLLNAAGTHWIYIDGTTWGASSNTGNIALPIASGGTGALTAANARTNLDVYSKDEVYSKTETYTKAEVQTQIDAADTPDLSYIDFKSGITASYNKGRVVWSDTADTIEIHHSNNVVQQVGEETYIYTTNTTGSTILNGELIGLDPVTDGIVRYLADGNTSPIYFLGVATQEIPVGEKGRLTVFGRVRGLDTSGLLLRKNLYASASVAGAITNTKPTFPNISLNIGIATTISATDGEIFVRPILEQQKYYGSFFRVSNATLAAENTATPIQFNQSGLARGVSIDPVNTSRIVIANSGLYSFNFSCQLVATSASLKNVKIWLAVNGTAIDNSTMRRALVNRNDVTVQTHTVDIHLNANDYVEIYWASDDTELLLNYTAADSVAPFAPATPAATLQVTQVQ